MTVRAAAALLVALAVGTASAAPRKILVLQVEGTTDEPTRTRLTASVVRLSRVLDGTVQSGDTTFSDTAAAVGCDAASPACAEVVRTTLGVDELVYGTATAEGGGTVLVVRRVAGNSAPREVTVTLAPREPPERAEPSLLALFSTAPITPAGSETPAPVPPEATPAPLVDTPSRSRRDRNWGIAAATGGATMFLIGLAMWSSASSLQADIDNADTDSYQDFQRLREIEDKASSRAWGGNLLVLGGLALGGYGGWLIYKDRKAQRAMVTPVPIEGGAAVTLTLIGDGL